MRIHLTTNPGIEDVVELELRRRAGELELPVVSVTPTPDGVKGRVEADIEGSVAQLRGMALAMRSIHHLRRPLARFEIGQQRPLEEIFAAVAALDGPELDAATAFRVTGVRRGSHDFTSMDVQRVAGSAVRSRRPIPVSMKDFDLELLVQVDGPWVDVAVQHTRRSLSRRQVGPWHPRTALKPNVAYAMLVLALGQDAAPGLICDPCCGSGTVLIEAGRLYPDARLLAGDRYQVPLQGCRENLAAAGLLDRAELRLADARALAAEPDQRGVLDAIITNPPFGMRLGSKIDFDQWYHHFLLACAGALRPGGRLALLALKRRAFNRALGRVGGMRTVHVRVIGTGSAWPGLFVLERV